ncbi:riboflavin biosynthesis protein RibD [Lottiidibacillus patelloidae]|uniref:Riboflavin biosynthesis protein RibD n=1 Tax=Lottiidibacillus patelloidae TaxID=2670334 RepID=A0A263BTS4_9BACI|nr:bifunctional diaminohydroxyphosphoribosylaminopyrimidine deaminase/5-amino-6-(5-phosphoribosylamino)uracil reductase RibD [Lottiidibacillus patelloidae]OZM57143.1 riboflavin biosynthesis protein RibD [Lottiidibacillus patelloidae]
MTDKEYMALAISLAQKTIGQTSPNPAVGAVVVKDGRIVGLGTHLKAGEPHAEVHALHMAGENAKGSTIYVTLEPCSHFGKTPPCANLIIEKQVKRCVIASVDSNPIVTNNGIARLKEAGIDVEVGLLKEEAEALNPYFNFYQIYKRPFVTLKTATSLDGKIATYSGDSKWITGKEAREDVHKYRHEHDAILVGVGTVLADDPSLTCRVPNGGINPIRIILDTSLRTPKTAKVVTDNEAPTWIIVGSGVLDEKKQEFEKLGVKVIIIKEPTISISELLKTLGENGIQSLFVEGGAKVNGSFLEAKAFQQVITYIAPKLIGGSNAPTSFAGTGFENIKGVPLLKVKSVEKIGDDIKIVSLPKERV